MIFGMDTGYVIGGVLLAIGIGFAVLAVVLVVKGRRERVSAENVRILGLSAFCKPGEMIVHNWRADRDYAGRLLRCGRPGCHAEVRPLRVAAADDEFTKIWEAAPWAL